MFTYHVEPAPQIWEIAYKSIKLNKTSGIDDINRNTVLDFYKELKTPIFDFFSSFSWWNEKWKS